MRLRLELFVKSVPESRDFYTRVLAFNEVSYQPDGYSVFRKGYVQIALHTWSQLPVGHPLKPQRQERVGLGAEIVIEVDDLDTLYTHVLEAEWPIADDLTERPWGSRDFPVFDPSGSTCGSMNARQTVHRNVERLGSGVRKHASSHRQKPPMEGGFSLSYGSNIIVTPIRPNPNISPNTKPLIFSSN